MNNRLYCTVLYHTETPPDAKAHSHGWNISIGPFMPLNTAKVIYNTVSGIVKQTLVTKVIITSALSSKYLM